MPKRSSFFIFQSRGLFCDCFSIFVSTLGTRQQLLKTFQIPVLKKWTASRRKSAWNRSTSAVVFLHDTVFFSPVLCIRGLVLPANSCTLSSLQRPLLCERGDVMLFQQRSKRRQRAVACTAAALTHFSQVKDGFAAGEGPRKSF